LELAGQYASQQQAFRALLVVLGLAAVSVVAVMLIHFESFIEPLVILLAARCRSWAPCCCCSSPEPRSTS
jgi:multidrug efflux pump subunit AcrB